MEKDEQFEKTMSEASSEKEGKLEAALAQMRLQQSALMQRIKLLVGREENESDQKREREEKEKKEAERTQVVEAIEEGGNTAAIFGPSSSSKTPSASTATSSSLLGLSTGFAAGRASDSSRHLSPSRAHPAPIPSGLRELGAASPGHDAFASASAHFTGAAAEQPPSSPIRLSASRLSSTDWGLLQSEGGKETDAGKQAFAQALRIGGDGTTLGMGGWKQSGGSVGIPVRSFLRTRLRFESPAEHT